MDDDKGDGRIALKVNLATSLLYTCSDGSEGFPSEYFCFLAVGKAKEELS
jgi:hypothetical protein